MMADLVGELKASPRMKKKKKACSGVQKDDDKMEKMKARYDKAELNVNKIPRR